MKRPLAVIGFTMLGTLFVFSEINSDKAIGVALLATLIAFLICTAVKGLRRRVALMLSLITVAASLFMLIYTNSVYEKNDAVLGNTEECEITGTLSALCYKNYGNCYYIIDTDTVNGEKLHTAVRVRTIRPIGFEPTDRITVTGKPYKLGKSDDSYLNYYKSKGMLYGVSVYPSSHSVIEHGVDFSPYQLLLKLRKAVIDCVVSNVGSEDGAVICALLIGEKNDLSSRTQKAFQTCGVAHLFAVSGLHLSLWSMLIFAFLRKLGLGIKKSSAACVFFCIFFMLLTGFNPPVVRAGFMMLLIYAGNLFSREADAFNSIGLSLIIMLILNPYCAMSISLWLSLLATLGILLGAAPINSFISEKLNRIRTASLHKLLSWVISSVCVTLFVTAFTLPIYVFVFGNISLLTVIANLLLVSLGSLCMQLSGIAVALMLLRLSFLGRPVLVFASLIARLLVRAVHYMSEFPYALVSVNSLLSKITLVLSIALLAVLFALKLKNRKIIRTAFAVCLSLFILVNAVVYVNGYNKLTLSVAHAESGIAVTLKHRGRAAVISSNISGFDSSTVLSHADALAVSAVDYYISPDTLSEELASSRVLNSLYVGSVVCGEDDPLRYSRIKDFRIMPTELDFADDISINALTDKAEITFYQTKIVILFSDDIILDSIDADLVIGADSSAQDELIQITKDGRISCGDS